MCLGDLGAPHGGEKMACGQPPKSGQGPTGAGTSHTSAPQFPSSSIGRTATASTLHLQDIKDLNFFSEKFSCVPTTWVLLADSGADEWPYTM